MNREFQPGLSRRTLLGTAAAFAWLAKGDVVNAQDTASGRRFYVSPSGSDVNPGTAELPFATISAVFSRVADLGAGDAIVVMPGDYLEAVVVRAGGDATANLVLMSQQPHAARIRSPADSYSAIAIEKSYVTIDGFDVQSGGSGHGIEATFLDGNNTNNGPHHVVITNNICHDSAGSGISMAYGDFYRIEDNVCYGNCATNTYQGSGISVYEARAVDGTEDLRVIVARNTCYKNMALTLPGDVPHSDGNGIIIDDMRNTQKPNPAGSYKYQSLVENNVCYSNGGKGIHVFISDNVTVRNNTCCYNNRDPKNPATWRGELSNVDASHNTWINNIAVADLHSNPSNAAILDAATAGPRNENVVWEHNLTFNGTKGAKSITQSPVNPSLSASNPYDNMLGVDPQFVRGGPEEAAPDFHLRPKSPARNAGIAEHGVPTVDRNNEPRDSGKAPDLGAFVGEAGG